MKLRLLSAIALLAALLLPQPANAASKKEMEEAKTIAFKNYLRYANDGSGYLDDVKVTTVAELKSKLKAKELENIKALEAVSIPGDYENWDKTKFVEYWGKTFFASPGLSDKGRGGKTRTAKYVNGMTVTPPGTKTEEAPKDTVKKEAPAPESTDNSPVTLSDNPIPPGDGTVSVAEAETDSIPAVEPEVVETKSSINTSTWIYVAILLVLVGFVIWLVIYASKSMGGLIGKKKEDDDEEEDNEEDDENAPEKDENFEKYGGVKRTAVKEESAGSDNNALIEKLRKENDELRFTTANLQTEVQALNRRLQRVETERDNALATLNSINEARKERKAEPKEAPRASSPSSATRTYYLGRVNDEGIFVRADREYNPKGSIYRFVTTDGVSGSFYVIDSEETREFISLNPKRMLAGGCTGEDFGRIEEIDDIETLSPGTAVLDDKRFRMVRKARVRIS